MGYGGGATVVGLNLALTTYTIVHEYQNDKIDTHSYVNGVVTGVATGLMVTGLIITAPVWGTALAVTGAVLGVGYGIWQLSGGDEIIDNASNHWGRN